MRAAIQGCRRDTRGEGNGDGLGSGAASTAGTPATATAAATSVKKKDRGYEQGSEFPVHRISVQIERIEGHNRVQPNVADYSARQVDCQRKVGEVVNICEKRLIEAGCAVRTRRKRVEGFCAPLVGI